MPMNVYLRFDLEDGRAEIEDRLRKAGAQMRGGELIEEDGEMYFRFDTEDENAALVRAQTIVRGVTDGTDIDPSLIARTLDPR